MKVHHFGYLIKDMDKAIAAFKALGFVPVDGQQVHYDEFRDINILFIEKDGYCVELISPHTTKSSFYPLLKRFRNCSYHICYVSTDVDADVRDLTNQGWRQITPFDPASALDGKPVGFFMHPSIGMLEIIDSPNNE